jgi:hypothetical protein
MTPVDRRSIAVEDGADEPPLDRAAADEDLDEADGPEPGIEPID